MDIALSPDTLTHPALLDPTGQSTRLVVDDPAVEAAPIMRDLAQAHCHVDDASGETCLSYHGYSLYQSLLVQKTPRWTGRQSLGWKPSHGIFFLDAVRSLARTGTFSRALVSASSDYMLPSLIVDACRQESNTVQMTLVDVCETPLRINQWYAARRDYALETIRSNILDFEPASPFDLLCTHHLLNFVAPDRRPALFQRWRGALRPGGRLVFVNSIRPSDSVTKVAEYAEVDSAQLAQAVAEAEERLRTRFPPHDEILKAMIERLSNKKFFPVQTPDEIAHQLMAAGFAINQIVSLDSYDAVVPGWTRRANKKGTMGLIATAV